MTDFIGTKGHSRGLLLGGLAAVTLILVAGIKLFMSDDTAAGPGQSPAGQELFKEKTAPQGANPAARSETGSGGGLEMFSKTNAGYYGEEASTAAAAEQTAARAEVRKSTAPAAKAAGAKAKPKGTVIPRMKSGSFGNISPTNVSPGGAGQGMPDISGMLKQAQQQSGKNSGD